VIELVSNEKISGSVEPDSGRAIQAGAGGGAAVTAIACCTIPHYSRNDTCGSVHAPDTMIVLVSDEDIACGVQRNAEGGRQISAGGGAAITAEALRPVSRGSGNESCGNVHLTDAVIQLIRDKQVAEGIHYYPRGAGQASAGGGAAITAEALRPVSRHSCNDSGYRVHAANPLVKPISYEQVSCFVNSDARRRTQAGTGGGATITPKAADAIAGHC
jgi:hypothetical protein